MNLDTLVKQLGSEELVIVKFWNCARFDRGEIEHKVKDLKTTFKKELFKKPVFAYARQQSLTGHKWIDIWLKKD